MSHAFHDQIVPQGWENTSVRECYDSAMEQGLYDSVAVHGPQGEGGKTPRAYACANAMEYFAELSTAFHCTADDEEFNKWFPFNRSQLALHDPRAHALLTILWSSSSLQQSAQSQSQAQLSPSLTAGLRFLFGGCFSSCLGCVSRSRQELARLDVSTALERSHAAAVTQQIKTV